MIKNKNQVEELLKKVTSFTYIKESVEVDVSLKEEKTICVRYNASNCFIVNYMNYEDGISALYKDRKYLNKELKSVG